MSDLNLDVPVSWHSGMVAVLRRVGSVAMLEDKIGLGTGVVQAIRGASAAEGVLLVNGFEASWYLGAAIGSVAVATGRYLGCGTTIVDALAYASGQGVFSPSVRMILLTHPEIVDPSHPLRRNYGPMARRSA